MVSLFLSILLLFVTDQTAVPAFNLNDAPMKDVLMWLLMGSCSSTTKDQQTDSLKSELHNYMDLPRFPLLKIFAATNQKIL